LNAKILSPQSGADVMITIGQKKLAFFSQTNVMINFFSKTSSLQFEQFEQKTPIFRQFFGGNNFKIIASVPG
jgi:hypothetical protein